VRGSIKGGSILLVPGGIDADFPATGATRKRSS
jgi:hypothetical protein